MRNVVIAIIVLLAILHQDFWWWDQSEPMLLGFVPIGLAWHVGISLCAGLTAFLAVRYCWPEGVDVEEAVTDVPPDRRH